MSQVLVQPGNVDANRTLWNAALATCTELAETSVHQLAGSGFPRASDATGIRFATKGVTADSLEVGADVQTRAATDAVQRFVKDWVLAHVGTSVVDKHEMEFARLVCLSGRGER